MRKVLLLCALAGAALVAVFPATASAPPIRLTVDVTGESFLNPCVPELVTLSGSIQIVMHETADANGGFHGIFELNAKGVSGVGSVTGDTYRATGGDWVEFNTNGATTLTDVDTLNLVSQGSGSNLVAREIVHFTFNADGTLTADVEIDSAECRG